MTKIYSKRLQFRKPDIGDVYVLFTTYTQDSEVTRFTTWKPHVSIEETKSFIKMCIEKWNKKDEFNYIIESKENKRLIGMIKVKTDQGKANVGYVIARQYWNNGYATESVLAMIDTLFGLEDITEVRAFCDVQNNASAKVMAKAGMNFVKNLPNYIIHPNLSNDKRDCLLYSITKDEYEKNKSR
jgi:RimJ/RimL family protein N-acetyltransferase